MTKILTCCLLIYYMININKNCRPIQYLTMKTKVENKVTILSDTLKEFFGEKAVRLDHISPVKLHFTYIAK